MLQVSGVVGIASNRRESCASEKGCGWISTCIAVKETLPAVLAVAMWGIGGEVAR